MRATAKNAGFNTQITFSNHGKAFTRMYQMHKHDNGVNYQYAERKCAQSGAHLPVIYDAENAKELIQGLGFTESHIPVGLKLYQKRKNRLEYLARWSNGMPVWAGMFEDLQNSEICKDIKAPSDKSFEYGHYEGKKA